MLMHVAVGCVLGLYRCNEKCPMRGEDFYEQRLLLGLAWRGEMAVEGESADRKTTWQFTTVPPDPESTAGNVDIVPFTFVMPSNDDPICFEDVCRRLEEEYDTLLGCDCCCGNIPCKNCIHAVGFHECVRPNRPPAIRWKCGTLHGGKLDPEGAIMRFHKKGMNIDTIRMKIEEYVRARAMGREQANRVVAQIETARRIIREANVPDDLLANGANDAAIAPPSQAPPTTRQLEDQLRDMERNMQQTQHHHKESDQWAVYQHVTQALDNDDYLHLVVQADAGAGKSYLLKAIALQCLLRRLCVECCAPTGIAAANLEIEGTSIAAVTIHKLFVLTPGLDNRWDTKLNFNNVDDTDVAKLMNMQVLLLDEGRAHRMQ